MDSGLPRDRLKHRFRNDVDEKLHALRQKYNGKPTDKISLGKLQLNILESEN